MYCGPFQSQRLLSEEKRREEISRLSVELQSKADQLGSKVEELDKLRSENSKLENRNHDLVLTVNNLKICQGQNQKLLEDLVLQKSQLENDLKTSQEETSGLAVKLVSKVEELDRLKSDSSKLQSQNDELTLRVEDLQTRLEQNQRTKDIPARKEEEIKGGQKMKNDVQGQYY